MRVWERRPLLEIEKSAQPPSSKHCERETPTLWQQWVWGRTCSSSSPSLTFFSGQGTLLQSSKSELGVCKLLKENRFPEVFSISLWSDLPLYIHCWAGQNCSIFASLMEVEVWPKWLLQAAVQFFPPASEVSLTEPNKNPELSTMEAPCPRWGDAFAQMN